MLKTSEYDQVSEVSNVNLYSALSCRNSKALRYDPCITRDHTVLPATHTRTIPAFTLQPQGITALWLALIVPSHEGMARLSRPGWLVIYRDRCPATGIELGHGHPSVLIGPDVG